MTPDVDKNRTILQDAIKKLGKKRLSFDEKDIEMLSKSKSFDFVDYLKKIVVLNKVTDTEQQLEIEADLTAEYKSLLEERREFEVENNNLDNNKRYKNIKAKTDYGLPFFIMQGYFQPKTLNKISKQNPDIVYKLDNEIDRRARRSRYYKEDKPRAVSNAIVNVFRDEFPKADAIGLTKASMSLDNSGMTVSKVAAKTINTLCSSGVLSGLVNKLAKRVDEFTDKIKVKPENKWLSGAKNLVKVAASAAAVAIVGNEAMDLINTPMPPMANLGVKESIELIANVDLETVKNTVSSITPNEVLDAKEAVLDTLQAASANATEVVQNVDLSVAQDEEAVLNFIADKMDMVQATEGMTLESLAHTQLDNPTVEQVQQFVSAVSEYNDIDNPNMIFSQDELQIPNQEFIQSYQMPTFEVSGLSKKEIFEQMKDVTIHYGETQSQLIDKLSEGLREIGGYKAQQIEAFKDALKEAIPVDLKAHDVSVSENIKEVVEKFEKLTNKSQLKFK